MTGRPPVYGCAELEARLEALVEGRLGAPDRAACAAHLAACAACRELAALAGWTEAGGGTREAAVPPELLPAILERTTGSACGRAADLLATRAWSDKPAAADPASGLSFASAAPEAFGDARLLAGHLATCADCRALGATLAALARDLPALAEVAPDPGFVDDVLAVTSGRQAAERLAPPLTVRERVESFLAGAWRAWVRRPAFAVEAAYAGVLCLLVLGAPIVSLAEPARELGRALAEEPPRILERLEEIGPVASVERAAPEVHEVRRHGSAAAAAELDALGSWVAGTIAALAETGDRLVARGRESAEEWAGTIERTFRAGRASLSASPADGAAPEPPPPAAPDDRDQETP